MVSKDEAERGRLHKKCHECQITAGIKTKVRAPLQPVRVLNTYPFQEIAIDVLGGDLPRTARRNKYLLTIVCCNSRWIDAKPMANCKAETIADKLVEFFSSTSIPKVIRMDNMPSVKSEILTALPSRKATNDNEYLIIIPNSRQNEVIRFSQGNQTQQTVWNRSMTQVWGG